MIDGGGGNLLTLQYAHTTDRLDSHVMAPAGAPRPVIAAAHGGRLWIEAALFIAESGEPLLTRPATARGTLAGARFWSCQGQSGYT